MVPTDKQEEYAQLVFQGYSHYDAYVEAYDSHSTRNSIDVSASRLANNAKIALRIQELRNAAVTPLIADIVERKSHATSVMRNPSVRIRDQLTANKLIGEYEKDFVTQVESKELKVNINTTLEELRALFTDEQIEVELAKLEGQQAEDD